MKTAIQSLALPLKSYRTYLRAGAFVAGNLLLPQLCHTAGLGGQALLPILLFTLVAAARYGLVCGLMTAVLSPLANNLLFGMPTDEMLVILMVKSLVLAATVGTLVYRTGNLKFSHGVTAIGTYQIVGFALTAALTGSTGAAWTLLAASWPAMILQLLAVLFLIRLAKGQKA
jgi:hypothetical protein